MKRKYITAETLEAAEEEAEAFFGCEKDEINFEVLSGEEGAAVWKILAFMGKPEEIVNMDSGYELFYESDGVYLELFEARGAGQPLESQALLQHISRKNLSGISTQAILRIIAAGSGRAMIAQPQKEYVYGEEITVVVSIDETEARAWLLPPEPNGALLDLETIRLKLKAAGVTHGVDETMLEKLVESKDYSEPFVVAAATRPEDGENGKLTYHFSTEERTGSPREISESGGRVDYKSLDLYEPVTEGQLLVTRSLATEGKPGITVKGKPLKQRPGKDVAFPRGKNVEINEAKTEMTASCSGMVQLLNNAVNVSSIYKVNGDCDISVGNIDFDGSVFISGNVRSGNTIKATGGVVVGGTVEAATIIAGGNVEIKSGIQGADRGMIEAGGAVTALYVERGTIIADGSVTVDVSIHSRIETGGNLTARGRRGAIIGGRAGVAGNVIANYLGTVYNTKTEIIVGMMLRKRERIQTVEGEIERLQGELAKLDQLDTYLENSKERIDPETWDRLYRSGAENRQLNMEIMEELRQELDSLEYELEHATDGKAHVFDVAYNGVRIIIGTDAFRVDDDISHATFRYKDRQVVCGPCDLSKPT